MGYAEAQLTLGDCFEFGMGVTEDHTEAVKWYRMPADQNHAGGHYVGGIWGYTDAVGSLTMSRHENNANISGAAYVGGIIGSFECIGNGADDWKISLFEMKNTGTITDSGSYAGGIIGHIYLDNGWGGYDAVLYASTLSNSGTIKGEQHAGGLFGYIKTDSTSSSVMDITATGTVSATSNFGKRYGFSENIKF